MNGMQIWEVNGIDDLKGTCFAQCSTKEKANRAIDNALKAREKGLITVDEAIKIILERFAE